MNERIDPKYKKSADEINERMKDLNFIVYEMRDIVDPTTCTPFPFVKLIPSDIN